MTTAITFNEMLEAFKSEGINGTVEDTGGGCATLIIDGGLMQVGPGVMGEGFDTEELSYGFYTVDENGDAWEDSDAVWIEPGTTAADIAKAAAAAYRERTGTAAAPTFKVVGENTLTFNTWDCETGIATKEAAEEIRKGYKRLESDYKIAYHVHTTL
ncbi:hypothetical protein ArV1_030 [Arthrobacter phage vB_ArtM-ArV1]|uniref:Uncharacterized protein n=1 Tax=Arthrobacter phage vB_ArtM-ArV1 TaxID=1566993 RepID=A0A0A7HAW0_9CAUD|nr:hypothetical protein ArV1_030 [Arthrobacter phage vB_ArtM-ArV1]AIZ01718.1 hypothetical protein ArV1_030 [Arthrobacter phage vB_ArtM-ArV1]